MKIEIRYESKGGKTKRVADAIGEELKVTAKSIEEPIKENVDIL